MALIAGLAHNLVVGAIFGTFSVMLASVADRTGVSIGAAALGVPVTVIGASVLASVAGVLVARHSLRLMFLIGALLTVAAFLLLAFTDSYAAYLAAYGLLLGPGMALAGSVAPATLVTRWFSHNRGLALGLVHLPVVVTILPVASNWLYEGYGARTTYLALAALVGVLLIPASLLTRDFPPGQEPAPAMPGADGAGGTADGSLSVTQLLSRGRFWMIAFAAAAMTAGAVTLGSVLMPMAASWGIGRADAAVLASIMAGVGMVGSIFFGWLADRIGGGRGLAVITLASAVLWSLLLLRPPFAALAAVIGLIGMCGAGIIPNLSRVIADSFGPASFSRGFGLVTTLGLPLTVAMVPGFPAIAAATGSYAAAIVLLVGCYVLSFLCALVVSRR
jgi:MFS family permease